MLRYRNTIGVIACLTIVFIGTPAVAGPAVQPTVSCKRIGTQEITSATLSELAGRLLAAGKTQADVENAFQTQLCLRKVSSAEVMQPLAADPSDINWNYSSIFYDDDDHRYHASIGFKWVGNDWYENVPWLNGCYNTGIGGPDGLGIRLSGGEYIVYNYSMLIWGRPDLDQYDGDYGWVTQYSASSVSQYGVGFTRQDNARSTSSGGWCMGGIYYKDYDIKNAQLYLTVRAQNGVCRTAQVFGDYSHTWNNTRITGISAGPWSFGISWDNGSDKFDSSAGGTTGTIC